MVARSSRQAHGAPGTGVVGRRRRAILPLVAFFLVGAGALVLTLAPDASVLGVDVESSLGSAVDPTTSAAAALATRTPIVITSARPIDRELDPRANLDPAEPRTEAEHIVVLRALARADSDAFGRRVRAILGGNGPACEQFAALRAACEERWPGTAELCVRAASTLPTTSGPQAESVPQTLVHWLARRAPREPFAREILSALVWSRPTPVEPALRSGALRALVLASPAGELDLLAARIQAEGDPDVHCAGRTALDERTRPTSTEPCEEPS